MDFIKRNMFLVILGSVVIIGTAVLMVMIFESLAGFKERKKRVEEISRDEEKFKNRSYKLDKGNFDIAENNRKLVQGALDDLQEELRETYTMIDFSNHDMTPVKFKESLRNRTEVMHQVLQISQINVPGNMRNFGFDNFLQPAVIPSHEQIAAVTKQLQIYDEIVDILSRSNVKDVKVWAFKGDNWNPAPLVHQVHNENLYQYYRYEMSVTASVPDLQVLLKNFNDSSFCFVIRWMSVGTADDSVGKIAGAAGSAAPTVPVATDGGNSQIVESPKSSRVIFTDFAPVTMSIAIDYIEFLE